MRLLALNVRYFGKVKWDPNVINTLSTMLEMSWWDCREWKDNPWPLSRDGFRCL